MINIEEIRSYCLLKKGVTESFPFNDTALVFKVLSKMFALLNIGENKSINLKCNPEEAIKIREEYSDVSSGYHMNKKHWNTIKLSGNIDINTIIVG